MQLRATEVQAMLEVPDGELLAYGYTLDRLSVYIYFEKGRLIRSEEDREGRGTRAFSDSFEAHYFHTNMKRWYRGNPDVPGKGFNPKLLTLFETFGYGYGISFVDGGHY